MHATKLTLSLVYLFVSAISKITNVVWIIVFIRKRFWSVIYSVQKMCIISISLIFPNWCKKKNYYFQNKFYWEVHVPLRWENFCFLTDRVFDPIQKTCAGTGLGSLINGYCNGLFRQKYLYRCKVFSRPLPVCPPPRPGDWNQIFDFGNPAKWPVTLSVTCKFYRSWQLQMHFWKKITCNCQRL